MKKNILKPYHYFIAPAFIFILFVSIYPLLYGFGISLTNLRYDRKTVNFIGLDNYLNFFSWEYFPQILGNSLIYLFFSLFITLVFGTIFALALNQKYRGRVFARTVSVLPWVLPAVIVGVVFQLMFSSSKMGLLNSFLLVFGLESIRWLTEPAIAMIAVIITFSWRTMAFGTIVILAGLQTVPPELYEVSKIDGIGPVNSFRYITLPYLKAQILVVLVMVSAGALNQVDSIMSVTGGGPGRSTEILALAIYREGFEFLKAGFAASISMFVLFINICITVFYFIVLGRKEGDFTHAQ